MDEYCALRQFRRWIHTRQGAAILLDSRDGDADTRSSGWKMAHQYDIIPGSAVAAALQATDGRRLLVVSYYAKSGRGNVDVGCRARQMVQINERVSDQDRVGRRRYRDEQLQCAHWRTT